MDKYNGLSDPEKSPVNLGYHLNDYRIVLNGKMQSLEAGEGKYQSTSPTSGKEDILKAWILPEAVDIYSRVDYIKEITDEIKNENQLLKKEISQIKKRVKIIEEMYSKELELNAEINKEMIELEKKAETLDPFQLAKGLLKGTTEDFEKLLQER